MVKAVIFDCFGVFFVDPFRLFIGRADPAVQDELRDIMLQNDLTGIDPNEIVRRYAELTGKPEAAVRQALYGTRLVRDNNLLAYTQELRKYYKVAILSNLSPGSVDNYFTQAERANLFDDMVISCEVGLVKPQPEIFRLSAQRLGIDPHEAVFIDDIEVNCAAARAVGMQAIRYTGLEPLKAALRTVLGSARA